MIRSQVNVSTKKRLGLVNVLLGVFLCVVVLAMLMFSAVYLLRPSLVSNLISVFPSLVVQLPLNLSLQNQQYDNVADLLRKQEKYGGYLGETQVMAANLVSNAERALDHAVLSKAHQSLAPFLNELAATYGTDQALGLELVSKIYSRKQVPFPGAEASMPDSLKDTMFYRFVKGRELQVNRGRSETRRNSCDENVLDQLGFHSFSPVVSSSALPSSGVPIVFAEVVDRENNEASLSAPVPIARDKDRLSLDFGKNVNLGGEVRLHVFARPGTMIDFGQFKSNDMIIDMEDMSMLLKDGFFVRPGQIMLTKPMETILIMSDRFESSQLDRFSIEISIRLARGVQMPCG